MAKKLGWGVMGTGRIASRFVRDMQNSGKSVLAVGSRSLDPALLFATDLGIARAYGSYEELVADPDIDVIYVATIHPRHADCSAMALKAGKHVLVEKPFTLNAAEARALVDLASEKGLVLMEGMWTRYLPHMVRIRKLLGEGRLGEICTFIADYTALGPLDPEDRLNSLELGGGALLDIGIYPFSFASDILGTPCEVVAKGRLGPTGADTDVFAVLTYLSGARSSIVVSLRGKGQCTAHIIGADARIDIDPGWYLPAGFTMTASDGTVLERFSSSTKGSGMQYEAAYMERLIHENLIESSVQPLSETITIMETLDQIRRQIGVSYPGDL